MIKDDRQKKDAIRREFFAPDVFFMRIYTGFLLKFDQDGLAGISVSSKVNRVTVSRSIQVG